MTCNCKQDIEQKLLARVAEQEPQASDIKAEIGGYVFLIGAKVAQKPALPVDVTYQAPKAKGGLKTVKQKLSLTASFCPFCGISLKEEEVAA